MTDIKDTTATKKQAIKPTAEAEALADVILRAAGSGLHFYSMAKTRDAILIAAQEGLDAGRARLLAALQGHQELFLTDGDHSPADGNRIYLVAQTAIAEATKHLIGREA